MRYIYDGELRNATIDPPKTFVFSEPVSVGCGLQDLAPHLSKLRTVENRPLVIGHEREQWRWTDR